MKSTVNDLDKNIHLKQLSKKLNQKDIDSLKS